ncbi:hypothetical protein ACFPPD_16620 [Cohnella suwonensis]|uniref:Uncharacterized protein n=1 Tax=Cohnella suwonensis TaxID=696072 RepID=A0ABW0LZJ4_9BACL
MRMIGLSVDRWIGWSVDRWIGRESGGKRCRLSAAAVFIRMQ